MLLSVCINTYNQASFIKEAIESVLAQITNFTYEILIGEDDSDDGTREICKSYADHFPEQIRLFLNERRDVIYINGNPTGRANAMKLWKNARGKYIALLDGDDYWTDPYKLQKQVDLLESNPGYSGCFHETQQVFEDGQKGKIYGRNTKSLMTAEDTFSTLVPFHTSSFVFKNTIREFPEWFYSIVSADMALFSIAASYGPLGKISEIMSVYRKHEKGITSSLPLKNSYHQNRIELMMHLDKFHNFKYFQKANEVIQFHRDEIKKEILANNNADRFLNISFTPQNADLYYIRTSIKKAIDDNLVNFKGIFLDLGCGEMPYRNYIIANSKVEKYIGIDIENPVYQKSIRPDKFWDGKIIPLEDNSIDTVMATELFEHVPDIQSVLVEINRVLKPGGKLFFTVPYLWPLHDVPYDEYRYTPFSLERHLKQAAFIDISINALGGWNASLAQMIGLWIKRSGVDKKIRDKFAQQLFPFYEFLIETDEIPEEFGSNTMATSFSGIAVKEVRTEIKKENNLITVNEIQGDRKIKMMDGITSKQYCPVCKNEFEKFNDFGVQKRINVMCPSCRSLERHRLLWLYLENETNIFKEKCKFLEVAPIPKISNRFKQSPNIDYVSIDLSSPNAMLKMDLTNLSFTDNQFDFTLCYHVMEHVLNDRKAMAEIFRTLKPGGTAIIQVPMDNNLEETYEDPYCIDPQVRLEKFGQNDHVRIYAQDYKNRLVEAGFDVSIVDYCADLDADVIKRMRLSRNEKLYICKKPVNNIRKKVLIIQGDFPRLSTTFILDQMTALSDFGYDIENWSPYNPDTPQETSVHSSVLEYNFINRTKYVKLPGEDFNTNNNDWVAEFQRLNNIESFEKLDIIHVHFGPNFNLFEPLLLSMNIPVIVSFHGYDASKYVKKHGRNCYTKLFERADLLTVPSKEMHDKLVEIGCSDEKIRIHRYGIDLSRFQYVKRDFNKSTITFLSIARFVEKKGLEFSIKAFAKIAEKNSVIYNIVGEGKLKDELESLVKELGIEDKVNFLGALEKEEVYKQMKLADIFVLASVVAKNGDKEGTPVSIIEALATGLPVISTYHSGIPEVVQDGISGYLCPERDVECIYKNMAILISDPQKREKFSANGHKFIKDNFNIRSWNLRLKENYENLIVNRFSSKSNSSCSISIDELLKESEKYILQKEYEAAEEILFNILLSDAGNSYAVNNLAVIRSLQNKKTESLVLFKLALTLNPDNKLASDNIKLINYSKV